MAAVSASVSFVAGFASQLQTAALPQRLSVAGCNGLRACPLPKLRAVISRPAMVRRLTIQAAASPATLSKVQGIIATQLAVEPGRVSPEAKITDLGADSLDQVEIIMALEEAFLVNIDEEVSQKVSTVQEAADMIQTTISAQ